MILEMMNAIENNTPEQLDKFEYGYLNSNKDALFDYCIKRDASECFIYLTDILGMVSAERFIDNNDFAFYQKHIDYINDDALAINLESWMNELYYSLLKNSTDFATFYLENATTLEEVLGFFDFYELEAEKEEYLNTCDLVIKKDMIDFAPILAKKLAELITNQEHSDKENKFTHPHPLLALSKTWQVHLNSFINNNYAKAS